MIRKNLWIDEKQYEASQKLAQEDHRSWANWVRMAIEEKIEREKERKGE